jgi:hypothetical protein
MSVSDDRFLHRTARGQSVRSAPPCWRRAGWGGGRRTGNVAVVQLPPVRILNHTRVRAIATLILGTVVDGHCHETAGAQNGPSVQVMVHTVDR